MTNCPTELIIFEATTSEQLFWDSAYSGYIPHKGDRIQLNNKGWEVASVIWCFDTHPKSVELVVFQLGS